MINKYAPVPQFGELVEFVTQGPLVGDTFGVTIHPVSMGQIDFANDVSIEAIEKDFKSVEKVRQPMDLTNDELDLVKASLNAAYHSDVVAYVTQNINPVRLVSAVVEVIKRPDWRAGVMVSAGDVYKYKANLYEVIQSHITQADWTPTVAKALFKRFYEPSDDPWPWVQPLGAHDAYPIGARVTYGGFTWQNTINANVWQPGVTGWTNLTPPASSNWSSGVAYKVGDIVTYTPDGNRYQCLQAHASIATWTPPAVPALWKKL